MDEYQDLLIDIRKGGVVIAVAHDCIKLVVVYGIEGHVGGKIIS